MKQHPDEDAAIRRACRALAILLTCGTELKRKRILSEEDGTDEDERKEEEPVYESPNARTWKT